MMGRIVLGLLLAAGLGLAEDPRLKELIDPDTAEILRRINAVDAYTIPDLELRKDPNYAWTPADIEPYSGVKPYKEHFLLQMQYNGPGRAKPEPEHVDTVKIGFLGPIIPTVSVATGGKSHDEEAIGIKMLQGAQLAIEEANAKGGYFRRNIPFELVVSNDNGLWGSSGDEIIKMAYKDRVWAILGSIDGANTHIAIRVALKAELVMITSGDTDPTFIETNIPWVARVISDDRQQAYLLIDYMIRKQDYKRIGIIRSSNRYGRFGVREVKDSCRRLGRPVVIEMAYRLGQDDYSLQIERLKAAKLDAVVHWGNPREAAIILKQMRAMGMDQPFFSCDRTISKIFTDAAGELAEGVIAASPWNPDRRDPNLERFREAFCKRFNEEPETYAAHAYDGMNLLIWAIQVAGLNRAKIRDVIASRTRPWPGVTGDIPFSAAMDDLGEVFLARYEGGRWRYYSREDLQVPRGYIPPRDRVSRSMPTED